MEKQSSLSLKTFEDFICILLLTIKPVLEASMRRNAARAWVYPADVPKRTYQIEIIQTALLHNTLVCLPTGLGKTLIAAVVMHNFSRWFPQASQPVHKQHMHAS